ncbi:hypothetical protein EWI07_10730 [Sporolactobacillus sp. THM7-4]|nr:hypothetical protein EWI07_10730 [Sporolactobacillus sp. THM7-4]
MSVIPIILGVIAFIFYIAHSVEKQNEQERKRREARRGRRPDTFRPKPVPAENRDSNRNGSETHVPHVDTMPSAEKTKTAGNDDRQERYREALTRLAQSPDPDQGKPETVIEKAAPAIPQGNPIPLFDRQRLRDAFILAECIGKPRAVHPHPFFRNQKYKTPGGK